MTHALQKYNSLNFISRKGLKLTVSVTGRRRHTEDCYIDPYFLTPCDYIFRVLLGTSSASLPGAGEGTYLLQLLAGRSPCLRDWDWLYLSWYLHIWFDNTHAFPVRLSGCQSTHLLPPFFTQVHPTREISSWRLYRRSICNTYRASFFSTGRSCQFYYMNIYFYTYI